MCLRDTEVRFPIVNARIVSRLACRFGRILTLCAGIVLCVEAQTAGPGIDTAQLTVTQSSTTWKRIAGTAISAGLAGAASGPIAAIWYAAGTGRLLVETESSRVFETSDFIHWRLNTDATAPAASTGVLIPATIPEPGAKVQAAGAR